MKLLPCPWCGREAKLQDPFAFWVECTNDRLHNGRGFGVCGIRGPNRLSARSALRAWNRVARAMQKGKKN